MKKIITALLIYALIFSVCATFAFAEDGKGDEPAFERIGLDSRTLTLTENNGKTYPFITGGKPASKGVEGTLTAEWIKAFDINAGYSEDAPKFYVPDGIFVDNVKFTGGADVLKNLDGYEWRGTRIVYTQPGNCFWYNTWEDYYTLQQYDVENSKSIFTQTDKTTGDGTITYGSFSLDYNGQTYDKCYLYEDVTKDNSTHTFIFNVFYRVPEGYDGCIFGFIDTREREDIDGLSATDVPRGAGDVYFRLK